MLFLNFFLREVFEEENFTEASIILIP